MSKLVEALKANQVQVDNQTTSDKGDDAYHSSLNACVDLYASMGALRGRREEFLSYFEKAIEEGAYNALALLFKLRDIKHGCGERQLVRDALLWLEEKRYAVYDIDFISLIVKYGRWDDIMQFRYKETLDQVAEVIVNIIVMTPLDAYFANTKTLDPKISLIQNSLQAKEIGATYNELSNTMPLLAKWLPRKPKQANQRYLLNRICKQLSWTRKQLRQWCSRYTTTETLISAKKWDEVNYNNVPSQTMLKLRSAFKRNDVGRFTEWVESLQQGKDGVKVNANTTTPGQLVRECAKDDVTPLIEEQWKALPDYFNGNRANIMPIVDGSGSMYGATSGNLYAIDVAIGLGIYIAQRNQGIFHNTLITFGDEPRFIELNDEMSLLDKINKVSGVDDVSTNYDKTYRLILEMAKKHNLKQEDLPEALLVLSDMNFDGSISTNSIVQLSRIDKIAKEAGEEWVYKTPEERFKTALQRCQEEFAEAGYKAPDIIYWNLRHNGTFACTVNDCGVVQLSGYSASSIQDVLPTLSDLNPVSVMNKAIKPYLVELKDKLSIDFFNIDERKLTLIKQNYVSRKEYDKLLAKYDALKKIVEED